MDCRWDSRVQLLMWFFGTSHYTIIYRIVGQVHRNSVGNSPPLPYLLYFILLYLFLLPSFLPYSFPMPFICQSCHHSAELEKNQSCFTLKNWIKLLHFKYRSVIFICMLKVIVLLVAHTHTHTVCHKPYCIIYKLTLKLTYPFIQWVHGALYQAVNIVRKCSSVLTYI
jgi:hypothetical protein